MGRAPCCDKANVKRGPWSPEEDMKLKDFIEKNGTGGNWIAFPHKAGLMRCGKSCRLRWLNYLRPNIKHGQFTETEDMLICNLFATIGSRWSVIANHLPGRTDNDIKNYWNTKLKKKLLGIHPPAQTRIVRSSNHHQQQPFYFSPNMDIQNFHATTHEAQLMNTATAATSATAVPCLFQHYPVKEADDQKLELENNIKDGGGGLWSLLCNNNGVSAWGDEGGSAFNYGTSAINGCNELFLDDPNSASAAAAGDSYKSQEKDMYYNYC